MPRLGLSSLSPPIRRSVRLRCCVAAAAACAACMDCGGMPMAPMPSGVPPMPMRPRSMASALGVGRPSTASTDRGTHSFWHAFSRCSARQMPMVGTLYTQYSVSMSRMVHENTMYTLFMRVGLSSSRLVNSYSWLSVWDSPPPPPTPRCCCCCCAAAAAAMPVAMDAASCASCCACCMAAACAAWSSCWCWCCIRPSPCWPPPLSSSMLPSWFWLSCCMSCCMPLGAP
mmetsp:Transcript_14004/g.34517  ORF Transcript_14004/g.34517 Transcript_14004/m.34517 type:complete len:228 (+) Transcript_14004:2-685(+)